MNIRVTAEEMKQLGRHSIKLGDRSGDYLGSLGKMRFIRFGLMMGERTP